MVIMAMEKLLAEIRECRVCAAELPLGPRPVVKASRTAKILIIGQAPGTKVHETGIPWNDPSGNRLREWLDIDLATFYDEKRIAIMPMGFCYPGRIEKGGDAPPRPECAPLWHDRLKEKMPNVQVTLLVGQYAQRYYLGKRGKKTLTETVRSWQEYQPDYFVTPHPSWRSAMWLKKNPWFEEEILPVLRGKIASLI
ncbi:uracil-DNA glycosylase [Rhodospirillales bacterium 47_12_T64]|nr:uracil-DNA glycosylase [Rhodospirillales bacterium 47_12_T64]